MPLPRSLRPVAFLAVLTTISAAPTPARASDATALRLANTSGATGFVRVGNHPDFALQAFTAEAWVQRMGTGSGFTTDPTGSGIIARPHENVCGSNIASWHLCYSNTGQVMFNVVHTYQSSGLYLQSPALPDPLARHHLATTFDGDSARIFVDGVEVAAAQWTLGSVYSGNEDLLIGADNWACGYLRGFDGYIDDVRLWSVARTASQIAANKDCRLSGTEPGLVGYWTWDGGDFTDQTGHGHGGAAVGTAVGFGTLTSLGACATTAVGDPPPARAAFAVALRPSPARDRVTVSFTLPRPGPVTLDVCDVAGRRLAVWTEDALAAGRHEITRELGGAFGGVRFVRLRSGGETAVRTLIVRN